MLQGMAVEPATSVEVVAAWVVPKTVVSAVAAAPGWVVLGEYFLPKSTKARLESILSVSADGLTARVRLWDVTAGAALPGAVTRTSQVPARELGGVVSLVGNRSYQVQAECVGGEGEDQFAVIESAGITD